MTVHDDIADWIRNGDLVALRRGYKLDQAVRNICGLGQPLEGAIHANKCSLSPNGEAVPEQIVA